MHSLITFLFRQMLLKSKLNKLKNVLKKNGCFNDHKRNESIDNTSTWFEDQGILM